MHISSVELKNYRNYEYASIPFQDGINILYGDNAQGKTNILESLYVCATTKSHRGSKDKELIRLEQPEAHIRMMVNKKGIDHKIDMHLRKQKGKGAAIDGMPIKKSSELLGMVHMILFSPEDLSIIKNGPGERRRFLDMELCQLDKIYMSHLSNYNKVLNQRNTLLKQISFQKDLAETLDIWDQQMVKYGVNIIKIRDTFVKELNEIISVIHDRLSGGREHLFLEYEPSVTIENYEEQLGKRREQDIRILSTGIGPHRDDISFLVNDMDIRKFGSQGQQRTAALSLKLAEIELVARRIKDKPVLLLDDVLSELDGNRKNYLMDCIKGIQTIITCTGLDEFVEGRLHIDQVIKVTNGTVKLENHV
ncbi:MAG: DNA replication/repair protein RecF [Lachnospiraceae bacterium]|nr:DNA replication/repair protein RecF [Lachnospiraceae bacterium]